MASRGGGQPRVIVTEGPHKDTQDLRVHAFSWFNRFLKIKTRPRSLTNRRSNTSNPTTQGFRKHSSDEDLEYTRPRSCPSPIPKTERVEKFRRRSGSNLRTFSGLGQNSPEEGNRPFLRRHPAVHRFVSWNSSFLTWSTGPVEREDSTCRASGRERWHDFAEPTEKREGLPKDETSCPDAELSIRRCSPKMGHGTSFAVSVRPHGPGCPQTQQILRRFISSGRLMACGYSTSFVRSVPCGR